MGQWGDPSESESSIQLNSSSGSRLRSDSVEFPPLGSEDLIRLGEDLLHVHPVFYRARYLPEQRHGYVSSISNVVSRGKSPPMDLSSEEVTALAGTFRKVLSPRRISSQCLTPLVGRQYPDVLTWASVRTRGPDFWPTPSSADRESSLAWNCAMNHRTTLLTGSQTPGRESIMGSRCVSKWFEDGT